ncbi:MAG: 30S ribosome-binding factor RbfA [Clostridia bacterium]|nr:30S ribosome-binding factor RbfA [Clostridia bacterium]
MPNIDRVNSELQKHISEIIMHELRDPRLCGILTVIEVRTTNDLSYARVHVSYYGDEDKRKAVFDALKSSVNYIRRLLKTRVLLRNIPTLQIVEDTSAEYSVRISKIIDEATKNLKDDENI